MIININETIKQIIATNKMTWVISGKIMAILLIAVTNKPMATRRNKIAHDKII